MELNTSVFYSGIEKLGILLSEQQINQFLKYYEMLIEKNKVMNLTAITEFDEVVVKHFIDSISIAKYYSMEKASSVIDVGTGAGFPGIPLKIVYPDLSVTLLDSLNKRVKFLAEVCEELGLQNVEMIHGRAEDFGNIADYREKYDVCVSRAVANLSTLSEYCLPFVKTGGYFIPYKSGNIEEELQSSKKALNILGAKVEKIETFMLPDTEIGRSFVFIKKTKNMPKKYPRKAGLPSKEPL